MEAMRTNALVDTDPATVIKTLSHLLTIQQQAGDARLHMQPTIQGLVRANEALGRTDAADRYRAMLISWSAP